MQIKSFQEFGANLCLFREYLFKKILVECKLNLFKGFSLVPSFAYLAAREIFQTGSFLSKSNGFFRYHQLPHHHNNNNNNIKINNNNQAVSASQNQTDFIRFLIITIFINSISMCIHSFDKCHNQFGQCRKKKKIDRRLQIFTLLLNLPLTPVYHFHFEHCIGSILHACF